MASVKSAEMTEVTDREISTTRTFDAPRRLVWQAWTDPKHIEQWWGPIGFKTTTKHFDLRPAANGCT